MAQPPKDDEFWLEWQNEMVRDLGCVLDFRVRAAQTNLRSAWVIVNKALAEHLLGRNIDNRSLSQGRVDAFAANFLRGEYQLNGETIKILIGGNLADGQHRLAAIAKADIEVPCLIVWNLDPAVLPTIDFGRPRRASDWLKMKQVPNNVNISAMITAWLSYREGYTRWTGVQLSPDHVFATYSEAPAAFQHSHTLATRVYNSGLRVPVGLLGAMHFELATIHGDDAEYFFKALQKYKIDTEEQSAILRLRENYQRHTTKQNQLDRRELAAHCLKAWNFYRKGRPCGSLTFRAGGAKPEEYPKPI